MNLLISLYAISCVELPISPCEMSWDEFVIFTHGVSWIACTELGRVLPWVCYVAPWVWDPFYFLSFKLSRNISLISAIFNNSNKGRLILTFFISSIKLCSNLFSPSFFMELFLIIPLFSSCVDWTLCTLWVPWLFYCVFFWKHCCVFPLESLPYLYLGISLEGFSTFVTLGCGGVLKLFGDMEDVKGPSSLLLSLW